MKNQDDPYNMYMTRFSQKWPISLDGGGMFGIPSSLGIKGAKKDIAWISPINIESGMLSICTMDLTIRQRNRIFNKITLALGFNDEELDFDYDDGFVIYFNERDLDKVCRAAKVRKKRKLSEAERLKALRNLRNLKKDQSPTF